MATETAVYRYLSQEFHFSDLEIARIRYTYVSIFSEISKTLLLLVAFFLLHMHTEFLVAIVVLLSIRNFTGGIHLNHYRSCLAFTFLFLLCAILLSRHIVLSGGLQVLIMGAGTIIVFLIGGVSSDKRPAPSHKRGFLFKMTACFLLVVYITLFLCVKNLPWKNLIFWVIVLQITQLAAAKWIKERRKHNENQTIQ